MNRVVKRIINGFSLIELMTTLVILALLVGIAVPTYRDYQIRARMVDVVSTLESLLDQAKQQYVSAQTIPSSVDGIPTGVVTAYTGSKCIDYIYYNDGSTWANNGKAAMIQAVISSECGSGIPGYASGTSGASNTVSAAFLASGELLQQYCGSWADNGTQVPLTYLPSGCQNDAFALEVTG